MIKKQLKIFREYLGRRMLKLSLRLLPSKTPAKDVVIHNEIVTGEYEKSGILVSTAGMLFTVDDIVKMFLYDDTLAILDRKTESFLATLVHDNNNLLTRYVLNSNIGGLELLSQYATDAQHPAITRFKEGKVDITKVQRLVTLLSTIQPKSVGDFMALWSLKDTGTFNNDYTEDELYYGVLCYVVEVVHLGVNKQHGTTDGKPFKFPKRLIH